MRSILHSSILLAVLVITTKVALAGDIALPLQRARICIGKTGVVMRSKIQLDELIVNGTTSNNSTFYIRGPAANYTCDFDTANSIVAKCLRPGSQILNVISSFKFADPNRYHVSIQVDCVACPQASPPPAPVNGQIGGLQIQPVPVPVGPHPEIGTVGISEDSTDMIPETN